jgi:hypothetical protein
VFDNLARFDIELIVRNTIHMQGSAQRKLWNEYTVPRYTNRRAAKVVYHAVLQARFSKPKSDKRLQKCKRRLVAFQTRQLHAGGINGVDILVVNAKVYEWRNVSTTKMSCPSTFAPERTIRYPYIPGVLESIFGISLRSVSIARPKLI